MIKRILSIVLCIFCIITVIPKAYALTDIKATLIHDGSDFYITLKNDGSEETKIGVYRFVLNYNKDTAKLMKITAMDGAKLDYSDNNGKVTAIYLNTSGFGITKEEKKFIKIHFTKSSYGTFTLTKNDGANVDAEMLNIGFDGKIEISKSSAPKTQDNINSSGNVKIPTVDAFNNIENDFTNNEDSNDNKVMNIPAKEKESDEFKYFFLGILATLFVVGLTFTAYGFGKSKAKLEQEEKEKTN